MTKNIIRPRNITTTSGEHIHGNSKPVICRDNGKRWPSAADCATELGVSPISVSACCRGKIRTCKGLHLSYAYEDIVDPLCDRIQEQATEIENMSAYLKEMQTLQGESTNVMDVIKIKSALQRKRDAQEVVEKAKENLNKARAELEMSEEYLNDLLAKLS